MFKVFKIGLVIFILMNIFLLFRVKSFSIEAIFEYNTSNITIERDINNYYMILEIPAISLRRYVYDIGNSKNNIDLNVELLYKKDMYILVSHSGNGDNAYFKNLKQLKIGDNVILYIKNDNKKYKVNNIYSIKKSIDFSINKNLKNKLVLITCLDRNNYLIIECQR